ncbi:hypothetical protein IPM62_00410 [Candidatus Woesebacteria bacterium]|nr:MAG: hypothetical protein IPM62_00410 [Candidatus Woesebacteria bacterium]
MKKGNMIIAGFVIFALFVTVMAILLPKHTTSQTGVMPTSDINETETSFLNSFSDLIPGNKKNEEEKTNEVLPTKTPSIPKKSTAEVVESELYYKDGNPINKNGDYLTYDSDNFQILYFSSDDSFLISILNSDFDKYQKEAEQELLEILRIEESKACALKIFTTTSRSVNEDKAGKSYPLSFCN